MVDWRHILQNNFRTVEAFADFLELSADQKSFLLSRSNFPINVPMRLAQKMQKKTLNDPLLLQFIPLNKELEFNEIYELDPVGDKKVQLSNSLLKKYKGRSLLVSTSVCAMHCRYCFRKNYPYENKDKTFLQELEIIKKDTTIAEIILSGGDPLSLSNRILKDFFEQLAEIDHVKKLRFHTRFPIGIPERIDSEFLKLLEIDKQIWFVIHCNHPKELDDDIFKALKQIQKLGIPVLNQSVLLKGVNDEGEILKELYTLLANHGIFAYYLHQLDKVQGAQHFEVPEQKGLELMAYLEKNLPGYAVPKYVKEISGYTSKTAII